MMNNQNFFESIFSGTIIGSHSFVLQIDRIRNALNFILSLIIGKYPLIGNQEYSLLIERSKLDKSMFVLIHSLISNRVIQFNIEPSRAACVLLHILEVLVNSFWNKYHFLRNKTLYHLLTINLFNLVSSYFTTIGIVFSSFGEDK